MAKKSRTPPPPRRVQAPKRREGAGGPTSGSDNRARLLLYAAAGVGALAIAGGIGLFAFGGGDGSADAAQIIRDEGCTLQTAPASREGLHVESPPKRSVYNTWPPTSGPHHADPPAFDFYTDPVEQYRLVHNLEHGGIVVQYGAQVPATAVEQLEQWYRGDPNGIVVAPFPELGRQIALAAWTTPEDDPASAGTGVLAKCPGFRERALDAFVDAYVALGPERATREQLAPGT